MEAINYNIKKSEINTARGWELRSEESDYEGGLESKACVRI